MKKSLFSTKTMVATALGAALFMVLFMFVKVPSPVPETNLQIAYGISAFFAAVYGPVAGFLIAFIGHALSDFLSYGSPWWSWVVASGISALVCGLAYFKINTEGKVSTKDLLVFNVFAILGCSIAWVVVAPVLDIVIYGEPVNLVFVQGGIAFVMDAIVSCVIGSILLLTYSSTRSSKGSLTKE